MSGGGAGCPPTLALGGKTLPAFVSLLVFAFFYTNRGRTKFFSNIGDDIITMITCHSGIALENLSLFSFTFFGIWVPTMRVDAD